MSVRGERGLGAIVCILKGTWAAINFSDEIVRIPLSLLRMNPHPNINGAEVIAALRLYKVLALRLEKGEQLGEDLMSAFHNAKRRLEIAEPAIDAYAERQREIRAAQPRVSPAIAHARAAHALAIAAQPTQDE